MRLCFHKTHTNSTILQAKEKHRRYYTILLFVLIFLGSVIIGCGALSAVYSETKGVHDAFFGLCIGFLVIAVMVAIALALEYSGMKHGRA